MKELSNTQFFQVESAPQIQAKDILEIVYKALVEKGYNPVNQIVGYIMSGDPTYITSSSMRAHVFRSLFSSLRHIVSTACAVIPKGSLTATPTVREP